VRPVRARGEFCPRGRILPPPLRVALRVNAGKSRFPRVGRSVRRRGGMGTYFALEQGTVTSQGLSGAQEKTMFLRAMLEDDSLPALERAMAFNEKRHRLLAANVANVETPGYRRQDLNVDAFRGALVRALERQERAPGSFVMEERDFGIRRERGSLGFRRSEAGMRRHDGNNVDMDKEMALLARNGIEYNTLATLIKRKYDTLRTALQGSGSSA
jgi:flagellar basal-body rod protein FlgB